MCSGHQPDRCVLEKQYFIMQESSDPSTPRAFIGSENITQQFVSKLFPADLIFSFVPLIRFVSTDLTIRMR